MMRAGTTSPGRFAMELLVLRTERNISQSKLSAHAGLDHSYVCRLEHGSRSPSLKTVVALAMELRLSHDETCRLHIAAGYLPPGDWVWRGDRILRAPRKEDVYRTLRLLEAPGAPGARGSRPTNVEHAHAQGAQQ